MDDQVGHFALMLALEQEQAFFAHTQSAPIPLRERKSIILLPAKDHPAVQLGTTISSH